MTFPGRSADGHIPVLTRLAPLPVAPPGGYRQPMRTQLFNERSTLLPPAPPWFKNPPLVAISGGVRSLDFHTAVRRRVDPFPACGGGRCLLVGGRRLRLRSARLSRMRDPLSAQYLFQCRHVV